MSLAQCHMLWYLHLAVEAGAVITAYATCFIARSVNFPVRHRPTTRAGEV